MHMDKVPDIRGQNDVFIGVNNKHKSSVEESHIKTDLPDKKGMQVEKKSVLNNIKSLSNKQLPDTLRLCRDTAENLKTICFLAGTEIAYGDVVAAIINSAGKDDSVIKACSDDVADQIISKEKEHYSNSLETFEAYAQKVRIQTYEIIKNYSSRFVEGQAQLIHKFENM